ncbi:hypothetical protein CI109_100295 [Kwoniella shandongensis]|uniref:Uncharacterized protein n=1 Tax=Kwoniella shandongensis TaxID=1734106 RepID=A0A5M6C581_9TREE|nr:uncharacterized protein CI109_001860 [Kwoniella shandongensis]KAA5529920.1 hypothetical protein CI109_001860 [Kwoniella shandongensis]
MLSYRNPDGTINVQATLQNITQRRNETTFSTRPLPPASVGLPYNGTSSSSASVGMSVASGSRGPTAGVYQPRQQIQAGSGFPNTGATTTNTNHPPTTAYQPRPYTARHQNQNGGGGGPPPPLLTNQGGTKRGKNRNKNKNKNLTPEQLAEKQARLDQAEQNRLRNLERKEERARFEEAMRAKKLAKQREVEERLKLIEEEKRFEEEKKREEERKKIELEEWEKKAPYYTPMPDAKKGWKDLPDELLQKVVDYAVKKHALLTVNKKTCYITGPIIYKTFLETNERAEDDWDGKDPTNPPFSKKYNAGDLFSGLEHDELSPEAPFGRELKMKFLTNVTKIYERTWQAWRSDSKTPVSASLEAAAKAGIVVFPRVEKLVLHHSWGDLPENDPDGDATLSVALAAVTRPKSMCWTTPFRIEWLERGASLPRTDLRFAPTPSTDPLGGDFWVPEEVCHHTNTTNTYPLICYGTLNRLDYWEGPYRGDHPETSVNELSMRERAALLLKLIRFAHPESFDESFRATLSKEALARREATIWEFSQIWINEVEGEEDGEVWRRLDQYDRVGNTKVMKKLVLEGLPKGMDKKRFRFEEFDKKGRTKMKKCKSCGERMPINTEDDSCASDMDSE